MAGGFRFRGRAARHRAFPEAGGTDPAGRGVLVHVLHSSDGPAVIHFRAAGVVLLLAHLLFVGWLTLRPLDVPWMTAANLQPFAGIKADLALGPAEAVRHIGGGLLLLAPLGILLPMAGGRLLVSPWASLVRTVAAGTLISMAIELGQTGVPGQVVDVDSLLLNTVGVALAHLLVVPLSRARLRRGNHAGAGDLSRIRNEARTSPGEAPQGSTPTITGVGIAP
jgi:hypothetical protein